MVDEQECTLTGHSDWGRSVAYSPDGKHIVSWSRDSTVKVSRVPVVFPRLETVQVTYHGKGWFSGDKKVRRGTLGGKVVGHLGGTWHFQVSLCRDSSSKGGYKFSSDVLSLKYDKARESGLDIIVGVEFTAVDFATVGERDRWCTQVSEAVRLLSENTFPREAELQG